MFQKLSLITLSFPSISKNVWQWGQPLNVSRPGWTIAAVKFEAPAAFYHPSEVTTGDMRCASFTLESAASAAATRKVAAQETEAAKKAYLLFIYWRHYYARWKYDSVCTTQTIHALFLPRIPVPMLRIFRRPIDWFQPPPSLYRNAKLRQHTCRQIMWNRRPCRFWLDRQRRRL